MLGVGTAHYDFLEQQLEDCEARITAQIDSLTPPDDSTGGGTVDETPVAAVSPTTASKTSRGTKSVVSNEKAMSQALHEMMGVDLTAIPTIGVNTALVIASEIGPDFSAFPSVQHFCSWLGVAPGTRISGGKPLPGRSHKVVNPVAQALRMAAMTARSSQTFIGAKHRARLARKDKPVAITATARELACLIYLMITRGEEYVEQGMEIYEQRRLNRSFAHLDRRAKQLGYQLVQIAENDREQNVAKSAA